MTYETAGCLTLAAAAWITLACAIAPLIGRHLAKRREFDDSLTALAEGVGVLPSEAVELDPNYRSPLYDHIARVMAADVDREIYDYLRSEGA